jgi:hypothetical protein
MAQPEQKKSYQVSKNFKGVNTQASRTAIDGDEFAWLENAMPVGFGNVKVVGNKTTTQVGGSNVTFSSAVTAFYSANINNNDYIVAFEANGGAQYYNITAGTFGTVAAASKFSVAGLRVGQWKNERLLICDPAKGLFTWDGTNVVSVGSVSGYGITNGGSAYTSAPSVSISAPNEIGGVQATAVATITAGAVTGLTFTEAGTGYTSAPTITFTGGGGSSAAAVASCLSFATGTVSVAMLSGGTGYVAAPGVTFTGGGGIGAAGTAIVAGGQVIAVVMTNNGTGYTSAPTVSFSTGAAIALAVATTNANVDVQSFSGRVWLAQGRTVYYSAAGSYNNFVSVSAGNILLTDSTLHGNIIALLSANNFLYIFGDDSINVFSDVRVQTNGTSIFTNTNVSASVGTKRANAIFPYFRSVLFMNDYGVYALVGSTTSKLSGQLDGIFPLIDFSQPVSAGQVLLNNILCASFSFTYNDPVAGARPIQAVFFDKRWFFTSQGTVKYMTSAPVSGLIKLWATSGTDLYTMYTDSLTGPSVKMQSALWPLGDPIRDKQALKFGVEATFTSASPINVTVDSEYRSSSVYSLQSTISWLNNSGVAVNWVNNFGTLIYWLQAGYQLYKSDAQQYGKYLGLTITSTSAVFVLNTLEMEYELRARF